MQGARAAQRVLQTGTHKTSEETVWPLCGQAAPHIHTTAASFAAPPCACSVKPCWHLTLSSGSSHLSWTLAPATYSCLSFSLFPTQSQAQGPEATVGGGILPSAQVPPLDLETGSSSHRTLGLGTAGPSGTGQSVLPQTPLYPLGQERSPTWHHWLPGPCRASHKPIQRCPLRLSGSAVPTACPAPCTPQNLMCARYVLPWSCIPGPLIFEIE